MTVRTIERDLAKNKSGQRRTTCSATSHNRIIPRKRRTLGWGGGADPGGAVGRTLVGRWGGPWWGGGAVEVGAGVTRGGVGISLIPTSRYPLI